MIVSRPNRLSKLFTVDVLAADTALRIGQGVETCVQLDGSVTVENFSTLNLRKNQTVVLPNGSYVVNSSGNVTRITFLG